MATISHPPRTTNNGVSFKWEFQGLPHGNLEVPHAHTLGEIFKIPWAITQEELDVSANPEHRVISEHKLDVQGEFQGPPHQGPSENFRLLRMQ